MVLVHVKRVGQAWHSFDVGNVQQLLGKIEDFDDFERGGFLEDAQQRVVEHTLPLQHGMLFVWHPPLRGNVHNPFYCTKRALLQQRLPEPMPDEPPILVMYEAEPRAWRAIPKRVRVWPPEQLEGAIKWHVDNADNSYFRHFVMSVRALGLRGALERAVVDVWKHQVEPQLVDLLATGGLHMAHMKWQWEQALHVFEPILSTIAARQDIAAAQQAMASLGLSGTPSAAGSSAAAGSAVGTPSAGAEAGGATTSGLSRPQRTTRRPDRWGDQPEDSIPSSSGQSYVRADSALVASGAALEQRQAAVRERLASGAAASTAESRQDSNQLHWELTACKYVAVTEFKRYAKLFKMGEPLPLVDLWGQAANPNEPYSREADSAYHMINQLFSYMAVTGVQFGWLSCYCATWLAWRPLDDPDSLCLSRPFLHDVDASSATGALTTMAALSWLQHEACTAWLENKRHPLSMDLFTPPASTDDELPGPDAGGTQDDDDSKDADWDPNEKSNKGSRTGKAAMPRSKGAPVQSLTLHAVQLSAEIGKGASGVVFGGWCLGVAAAIKMVLCANAAAMVRHEAAVYQALSAAQDSGAIPKLLGVGRLCLGTPFIAMSLVAGTPLSALSRITPEVRAAAGAALRHIHAAGVAHGDLRRANIMVLRQPRDSACGSGDTMSVCSTSGSSDSQLLDAAGAGMSHCEAQSEGRSSPGCDGALAGGGGVRVVIVDLGRARLNASRATLQEEERYLQRLLR